MNRYVPLITVAVAFLLQAALVPYIAIAGVMPNALLLAAVTIALVKGPRGGMLSGFFGGILFDLLGTGPIGVGAFVFCLVGFIAGSIQENTFSDGWVVPLVIVFIASVAAEAMYAVGLSVLGEGGLSMGGALGLVLPAALYNSALAVLVYPWVARFLRREKPMTTFRRLA
ncbi:MAG: rod shape-determining protein MreD [Anaerosomatales bacterium]|nr:rod shape-determining protein MreD [Anaerosomatales bacterium]MDT8433555.1 rod shape-determining protein MreD [Anaerosomatales bacterium]